MENYIQQTEGTSLIKHSSFIIDLASCANGKESTVNRALDGSMYPS
jgi:hypothetical protein